MIDLTGILLVWSGDPDKIPEGFEACPDQEGLRKAAEALGEIYRKEEEEALLS